MPRPKHPKKELEEVLSEAETKGWDVNKGKKYFKMKCTCPNKCLKTVKISPSDPNYKRNLLGELRRATCWETP